MASDIITLANAIAGEKENIRLAITTAGVECPPETPLSEYAGKIATIPSRIEDPGTDIFTRGCDPTLTQETTSYIVPANYSIVDDAAFAGYENLQSVSMPNVYWVKDGVFTGSKKFTSLNAPYCRYVGTSAFVGTNIPKDYTNDTIERFGDGAFAGNEELSTVSLSNATWLGNGCFQGCTQVSSISIPKVKHIGARCFDNFGNGRRDVSTLNLLTWDFDGPSVEEIGEGAFANNAQLNNISMPNVKRIGAYAFCTNTSSDSSRKKVVKSQALNIPNCESIGCHAFSNMQFPSITVKDGCSIGAHAFSGTSTNGNNENSTLTKVYGKPGYIGDYAFGYCPALNYVDLSKCTYIGKYAFGGSYTKLNVIDLSSCIYVGAYGIQSNGNATMSGKAWIPSTLQKWEEGSNSDYLPNGFHIYTDCQDADSRPSGWNQYLKSHGTWHYGATHEDFLNA